MSRNENGMQMLRFFLVGCINVVVGTVTMLVAYYFFMCGYWLSSALNYLISSTCSYFLNRKYTFQVQNRSWKLPLSFALNIIVCYLAAYSVAQPITEALLSGISPAFGEAFSMLVGMVLFSILNYFGQAWFVFGKADENRKTPFAFSPLMK